MFDVLWLAAAVGVMKDAHGQAVMADGKYTRCRHLLFRCVLCIRVVAGQHALGMSGNTHELLPCCPMSLQQRIHSSSCNA
jgi:hypothetical protein